MSQTTPTIGLKKPEGPDPFLTQDFADNYDKIDAAFAARPVGGSTGGGGTGTGGGLTQEAADARYAFKDHGTHGGTSGGGLLVGGGTAQFQTASNGFATVSHNLTFTPRFIVGNICAPTGGRENLPLTLVIDQNSITASSVTVRVYYAMGMGDGVGDIGLDAISCTAVFMGVQ